jgi:hypothetical protein
MSYEISKKIPPLHTPLCFRASPLIDVTQNTDAGEAYFSGGDFLAEAFIADTFAFLEREAMAF